MGRPNYIPKTWDLPESITKRLGEKVGKQRLMNEDGHLLLLLHQVPKVEDNELRTAVVFWRNPAGEWKGVPLGGGLSGLEAHLASYRSAIHGLDEAVEAADVLAAGVDVRAGAAFAGPPPVPFRVAGVPAPAPPPPVVVESAGDAVRLVMLVASFSCVACPLLRAV